MRRLTDRQLSVLAAIERLGAPTIPRLASEFSDLNTSTVWTVVQALATRGKVHVSGDPEWVYLGDPADFPPGAEAPRIADDAVVRVSVPRPCH